MHTDIPKRAAIEQLAAVSDPHLITIVLRTSPITNEAEGSRITFGTLVNEAVAELTKQGGDKHEIAKTEDGLRALQDDMQYWLYLSHSLVVFASPDRTTAYRLPNQLDTEWFAGQHFRIVPLLRTLTFPHTATVLALSQNSVRLVSIGSDHSGAELPVDELPDDLLDTLNVEDPAVDAPRRRLHSPEGHDARLVKYARAVDRAITPVLRNTRGPLILAAAQPLQSVFRSVTTNPKLLDKVIAGNPDKATSQQLDEAARALLDEHYAEELAERTEQFSNLRSAGRAITDLTDIGRATIAGAVSTLYVDIDAHPAGVLDPESGGVVAESAPGRSLVDEISAQVLSHGGRVLVLRGAEVPGGEQLGAEVRFSI